MSNLTYIITVINEYNILVMSKIAIIGGGYLQLPIVKKAKEMGLEVHCFSWADGAVCAAHADYFYPISIIEKEKILEECRRVKIDAITTIASDVAVLTVNYVAAKMGLVSNPDEYSLLTTNKYLMRQAFENNDVPSPRFMRVLKGDNVDGRSLTYPLIVKPTDRSGSRGVQKVFTDNQLKLALERAFGESFKQEAIVEEYVEGREVSVESISYNGVHYILQVTDKETTGAPYFVELSHHQPSSLDSATKNKIKEIVLHSLDALHIRNGASHSELKVTDDGIIKVIEVGARMGGDFIGSDLVRLSTGYDFLRGVILVAMGQFEMPEIKEDGYSGVYFLSKENEHLLPVMSHWQDYPQIVRCEITDSQLRHIQESGDRSGYMIYKSTEKWICR